VRPLLVERRLGELPDIDRDRVDVHLAACSGCAALARETAGLVAALVADAAEENARAAPPADVVSLLSRRLHRAPAPAGGSVLRRAAAAAALVASLGVAMLAGYELSERVHRAAPATPAISTESITPVVRAELERVLIPSFRDLAAGMTASEDRHARELALIARWLEQRRVEDATQLASALAATRDDLRLTQEAMVVFANDVHPKPR